MTANEFPDPLWRLLTHLSLKLDFKYTVREQFLVFVRTGFEGEVDPDIGSSPVVTRSRLTVPVIFSDQRQLSVERDTDSSISRKLESGSVVESSDD